MLKKIAILCTLLLTTHTTFGAGMTLENWPMLQSIQEALLQLSQTHPAYLIALMATLPLVGVPISPFYLIAAAIYGIQGGMLASFAGAGTCIALSYLLASKIFSRPIHAFLQKRGHSPPAIKPEDQIKMILLIRLFPGVPFFIQNYLLGLANIPFFKYFIFSCLIQTVHIGLFVITGGGVHESSLGMTLLGISGIVALGLTLYFIKRRHAKKSQTK